MLMAGATLVMLKLPEPWRVGSFVVIATLLLTPSWVPATMVALPVPFGFLVIAGLFGGFIQELPELVVTFGKWHAVAFPVMALASYMFAKKVVFNKSLQPTAWGGG